MTLTLHHLDDAPIRARMADLWLEELGDLQADYPRGEWPYGKQLTDAGWDAYLTAMQEALAHRDEEWLATALDQTEYWQPHLLRSRGGGGTSRVDYDKADARRKLATTEFSIAYVRGVASMMSEHGYKRGVVYRAGPVAEPRHSYCTQLEGKAVQLAQLLHDHRRQYFPAPRDPAARPIPSGPHCRHSIRVDS